MRQTKKLLTLTFTVSVFFSSIAQLSDSLLLAYHNDNHSVEVESLETQDVDTTNFIQVSDSARLSVIVAEKISSPLDTIPNLSYLSRCVLEDSVYWTMVDSVFAKWDSMTVDPYQFDGAKYKDTAVIHLHDDCKAEEWCMPLTHEHYITSKFGFRRYRYHYGTDIRLNIGDTVKSVWDGVVRISKYNYGGYGHYVLVRHHNGLETIYGHMSKRLVEVGQEVKAGEIIGLGGNTGRSSGPHLHFEVRYKGNAVDPQHVFDFDKNVVACNDFELTPEEFEYIRDMRKAQYHKIRSGDTLGHIAVRYHTSINSICLLNGISRSTVLRIGRVLRVR